MHLVTVQAVSANDYADSVAEYRRDGWKLIDDMLYRLCREHRAHDAKSPINAKVHLIGRTYATGIERKVRTRGTQGSSISQVVDFFFQHRKQIDRWFVRLMKIAEPLDILKIRRILLIHGLLTHELAGLTIKNQSAHSYVLILMGLPHVLHEFMPGRIPTLLRGGELSAKFKRCGTIGALPAKEVWPRSELVATWFPFFRKSFLRNSFRAPVPEHSIKETGWAGTHPALITTRLRTRA